MNGTSQISLATHNARDLDDVSSGLARLNVCLQVLLVQASHSTNVFEFGPMVFDEIAQSTEELQSAVISPQYVN